MVELKLAVIRPGRRADEVDTIPVTIWNREAAAQALTLAPGVFVVVTGRVGARAWSGPRGERLFVELLAEHVTVDVATLGALGEPREATPTARPNAEPATPSRPAGARPVGRESVHF